jgi:5-methylcytosine-specific restriction endonuclease McrA
MNYGKIKADKVFNIYSKAIRLMNKNTCEYCKKFFQDGIGLQVHHFKSRRKESTRYDTENLICLCNYHHRYFHENPDIQVEFMIEKLGKERYDNLIIRSNQYMKKDRAMRLIEAKKFLEQVENENKE